MIDVGQIRDARAFARAFPVTTTGLTALSGGLVIYYGATVVNTGAGTASVDIVDGMTAAGQPVDGFRTPTAISEAHVGASYGVLCERGLAVNVNALAVPGYIVVFAAILTPAVRYSQPLLDDISGVVDN